MKNNNRKGSRGFWFGRLNQSHFELRVLQLPT